MENEKEKNKGFNFWDWAPLVGVSAAAIILLNDKKPVESKGFTYNCVSITVTNRPKFELYIKKIVITIINSKNNYKNPKIINYFDFLRDVLYQINKNCYDKFINGFMKYDELLIVLILFKLSSVAYLNDRNVNNEEYLAFYFNPQWDFIMKQFLPITNDEVEVGINKLNAKGFYP